MICLWGGLRRVSSAFLIDAFSIDIHGDFLPRVDRLRVLSSTAHSTLHELTFAVGCSARVESSYSSSFDLSGLDSEVPFYVSWIDLFASCECFWDSYV